MPRVTIKLKDGTYISTGGDYLSRTDDGFLIAWFGDDIVAVVRMELVTVAYLTEKGNK